MRKIFIAVAALAICACTKEGADKQLNYVTLSFDAAFETTKTALDGNNVVWCEGDQIAIFAGTEKVVATLPASGASVNFSVEVPQAETYYAVYPASEANTFDPAAETFHLNVPVVQKATAGSFADKANLSVAKTTSEELRFSFKNVLSAVKFQVASDVNQVAFYGNTIESLAGSALVSFSPEGDPFVSSEDGAASKFVIVKGPFQAGVNYYATMLSNEYVNGITVHVAKGNGVLGVLASNSVTVQRSHALNLGNLCSAVQAKGGWQDLSAIGSYKVKEANMWLNKDYADSLYARASLSLEAGLRHLMTNDESVNLLEFNVPKTQKFRVVVNRMIPEVRYYDEANDLKPFNLSFYANGLETQPFVEVGNVTGLFVYGDVDWDGKNIGINNVSAVDPQIIYKKDQYSYGKRVNFPVCRAAEFANLGFSTLKVSNSYTFGPTAEDWQTKAFKITGLDNKAVPALLDVWTPCQGGAAGDALGGPRGTYFCTVKDETAAERASFIGLVVDMRRLQILFMSQQIK